MAGLEKAAGAFPASKRRRWTAPRARDVLDTLNRNGRALADFTCQRGLGGQRRAWWRTGRGACRAPWSGA